jgi:hypothetical protein
MILRSKGTNGRSLSIPHCMEKGSMHRPAVPRRITHGAAKNSSMLEDTQMHGFRQLCTATATGNYQGKAYLI